MTIPIKTHIDNEVADMSVIMRDIASLRDDIAKVTRSLSHDVADNLTLRGGRAAKAIGHQIETQPVASLAAAFAVGFLSCRFLWR